MAVCEEYQSIINEALSKKNQLKKFFQKLQRHKDSKNINYLFHKYHEEVFEIIDCLKCANCCSTISPVITDHDIHRIAKIKKMKPSDLTQRYLKIDQDQDYVYQSLPCPFLNLKNHYCKIYVSRPKACREYPHTDHPKVTGILNITFKNCFVCPAVYLVVKKIEKEIT